ncbi:quercetin dioxygenase-like cupin family protein [Parvibaculum indicum]|uniref:cupin domain-containing protein n=1 Tax=Parvibaculum indicum TaxID=562969 RepID=UPI0014231919|nr:cupin domain-containing protein [Parvibaculum indicum]NIJ41493.1 quercetin dioxygenase-like cupin family protein [Parvibaculum indicum]
MKLNADFDRRAAMHAAAQDWIPSPMPGVDRKMLDRIGEEVARATSIVRYAPESAFSEHTHGGGEEFLVLEGVFQDEHGDYPAGSYVRNPPTSHHRPGAAEGCTIFVKLWQFAPEDRTFITLDTNKLVLEPVDGQTGAKATTLFKDDRETVRLIELAPNAHLHLAPEGGIEILCLDGSFTEDGEEFGRWSWLRLPVGAALSLTAGDKGCRLWTKEGHLRFVNAPV